MKNYSIAVVMEHEGEAIRSVEYGGRVKALMAIGESKKFSATSEIEVELTIESPEGTVSVYRYVNGERVNK